MYTYIILRFGLFLILNRNILSDASCSLPTDLKNSAWEYNYTKVSDNSTQSTILRLSTTTLQKSIINLSAVGTTIRDWTCINSLALSNTHTLVVFKSDSTYSDGPHNNYRLYLCMKFTKVTPDLYYFYLLSDISTVVTPNERVFVSEEGNAPANDAPMCSTFCKYTGSPKIRTLRRPETSDEIPGNAALCEPCNSTCEVDRCDPNPCQNNGSCVDFKENYTCTCTDGWKGENCTKDINECLDKKRTAMCSQHSDCLNTDGSYECNCKVGYQETNGTCTEVKMSTEDKTSNFVVVTIIVVCVCIVVGLILAYFWKRRYYRQSAFGVNSNTNFDGHKNCENELTEVEENLVVKT
ncbi:uncharacterized protein LOC134696285 isoform X2 [Mytilus trossulus]|uniref:uncharacterized protein LOC134696285 isoform X2 n=1 Tax=Mytilus trossulus TaxID=6551 RepID=UPI0030063867